MSQTTVSQDPQTGKWLVRNGGQIAEFDGNHDGRMQANRLALSLDYPRLVDLVQRLVSKYCLPGLEERAWRGAHIVAFGRVSRQPQDQYNNVGLVQSQSSNDAYNIQQREHLLCLCQDYQSQRAPMLPTGQRLCKHIIAFCLVYELDGRPPDEAGPAAEPQPMPPVRPRPYDRYGQRLVPGTLQYNAELNRLARNGYQPAVTLEQGF